MSDSRCEFLGAGVSRLTITRPHRLGAYTPGLCRELIAAIDDYVADDELRCLILTGSGRGFCTGGDISPDAGFDLTGQLARARDLRQNAHAVIRALIRCDKPIVSAINGIAVNGGLSFALACDLRLAAASARLGDTSGRAGLLPDEGGAWLFPRFMGYDAAYRMVALSEVYPASEALRLGLVTEVVPDDELPARAVDLARDLATRAPLALRAVKSMMTRGLSSTLEAALGDAEQAVLWVGASEDAAEGKRAFAEKRPPVFRGR